MMVDLISTFTGWLVTSIFDKVLYRRMMSVLDRDSFQSLADKALREILMKEDNRIIWNEIMTVTDLKMGDPAEFDTYQICNLLHGEYQELCKNFFQEWREEYLNQIYISASNDPVLRTLLEEIKRSTDLKKRLERVKEGIERKEVDIVRIPFIYESIKNFPLFLGPPISLFYKHLG
ncbi:MAG: hypothetical protein HXS44_04020 [Theionarchaea archaeon]|nr:hypothetical protein [Theionarchaea archaeon]